MWKSFRLVSQALAALLCTVALVGAQTPAPAPVDVAPTPPMGWNSWDSYGLTINEAQFRANADVLHRKLQPFGWQYAVIDEGWYMFNPEARPTPDKLHYALDRFGRYVPVPSRFPSSLAAGHAPGKASPGTVAVTVEDTNFAAIGASLHAQGLKFGIHIVRGIPKASVERNMPVQGSSFHAQDVADTTETCPWDPTSYGVRDNAAGQAWYDALLRQYASWGVDLLKVDCIADHPYRVTEIRQLRHAIHASGRAIVLSLSPGPTQLAHADEVASLANMWRISDDVWDAWSPAAGHPFPISVESQFARLAAWAPYSKPNHWPDADMLPFGELRPSPGDGTPRTSRLNLEEERTMLTLWAIARSPLILGANLTQLDAPTLGLLTNSSVLQVNQTATRSAEVMHDGNLVVWRADLPGGSKALAFFNLGEAEMSFTRPLSDFGADLGGRDWAVRNLWGGGVPIAGHTFVERIPAHGCVLLTLE